MNSRIQNELSVESEILQWPLCLQVPLTKVLNNSGETTPLSQLNNYRHFKFNALYN